LCTFGAGGVACSTDLSAVVSCADGRIVLFKQCAPKKCALGTDNALDCR
jgi:hypothetical protein